MKTKPERRRSRLDQALVERGCCASREQAQRAVLAGQVRINDRVAQKSSESVLPSDELTLEAPQRFVSRGGFKLEHALQEFRLDVRGIVALDIGASTGGFTDCLLQFGAARVYAIDVGRGQLTWKLRHDERVVVMEKVNARHLVPAHFTQPFQPVDLIVMDCSFISVTKILPQLVALVRARGHVVVLVKPQFEAGKAEVDRGAGVITDPAIHERVLSELQTFVHRLPGLEWKSSIQSPLLGPAGNKEFLILLART